MSPTAGSLLHNPFRRCGPVCQPAQVFCQEPLLHHEQCPRVPAWMAYTSEILVRQCSTPASPPALCAWAWHSHLHSQLHASDTAAAAHDPGVQVLGSPIAALLLWMDGLFGLRGWQILFLAEGLPVSATAGALSKGHQPPASIHLLVQTMASSACLPALSLWQADARAGVSAECRPQHPCSARLRLTPCVPCLQTVLCGVYLKLTLAESPATAKCLSPEEQQWLSAQKSHQEVWDGLILYWTGWPGRPQVAML